MKRLMLATLAVVLAGPAMAQSQGPMQQPPAAMPEQQKMQSQRDWQPEQRAARPPTHEGEEQKFGADQRPATAGQAPSAQSEAAKPIPEHDLNPPRKDSGK
jgi:hypothetical protein